MNYGHALARRSEELGYDLVTFQDHPWDTPGILTRGSTARRRWPGGAEREPCSVGVRAGFSPQCRAWEGAGQRRTGAGLRWAHSELAEPAPRCDGDLARVQGGA